MCPLNQKSSHACAAQTWSELYTLYSGGMAGRTALALKEMKLNEEPAAGTTALHMWLTPPMCSHAAYVDVASNETSHRL